LLRTEPLRALVIGAFVRGLSMRDVESLCEQAGLGKLSKSTASRICEELKERFEAFKRRSLYDVQLVALFLDATFISVRPSGPKEGVLVAWGFTEQGERVLLSVTLGMRESYEDWQALGRDLIARGLGAPMPIVADGAPGLTGAIEQCWPASDRQRCCVHRARNLYAKLPERERERVKQAYWQALDDAISETDAKHRLRALADDLDKRGFTAAAKCLADDLDALVVHLRYPPRHRRRWRSTNLLERSLGEVKRRTKVMGRFPGEEELPDLGLGGPRPPHHSPDQRHPLQPARPPTPQAHEIRGQPTTHRRGGDSGLDSTRIGNLSRREVTAAKRRHLGGRRRPLAVRSGSHRTVRAPGGLDAG
jgi:putative transposase